jgi:hypothetical protein
MARPGPILSVKQFMELREIRSIARDSNYRYFCTEPLITTHMFTEKRRRLPGRLWNSIRLFQVVFKFGNIVLLIKATHVAHKAKLCNETN